MRIDGRQIAEEIRSELRERIEELSKSEVVPKIAIITLGPESSWEAYVRQKIKVAGELGIKAVLINLEDTNEENLIRIVRGIDEDPKYHGIIIQRPIPKSFNRKEVVGSISPEKDIDGFRSDSKFEVPVWLAVKRILESRIVNYESWKALSFVVVGKGETAGGPIAAGLKKMGIEPQVIDSRTENPSEILKRADVIISCVGKKDIIRSDNIKNGVILIGVGTHGEDPAKTGQAKILRGDYEIEEIEEIAGAYTPTPGGVGPINLSYLFKNLAEAAHIQLKK